MNRKPLNKCITALFCAAIFAAPVLFFLLPKQRLSEREKRVLAEKPALSAASVADGSFTEELGRYVADHFPGRELFTGINAYYDLLSGRQDVKDYFLSGGRLFARPVEADAQVLDKNLERINAFSRGLAESEIPVTLMLVPSSGAVLLPEQGYPDEAIIGEVYARAETGHVDLAAAFRSCAEPGTLYYRTDHHLTSEGAFEAVCAYRRALGLPCPSRDDYTVQSEGPFYGSAYSASALWLTKPDSVELWRSGNRLEVTNETGKTNDGVFYPERLGEWDKYTVFLDGNHSLVRIENLSRGEGEGQNLLVIRDSFSNALGCFLADLYDKVVLVDLRYYKLSLTELMLREDIGEVLIEYSVDNFLHDANLDFLSVEAEALRQRIEAEHRAPNYFAPPPAISEEMFDGAYYVGDSIIWTLGAYCTENGKLPNTYIATNSKLSYYDLVHLRTGHMIYRGNYSTLPAALEKSGTKVLISGLGCNDLANYDLETCESSVLAFLELARETTPDITIILQSVMPIHNTGRDFNQQEVDDFNAWLKDNAEANGYCYIERGVRRRDRSSRGERPRGTGEARSSRRGDASGGDGAGPDLRADRRAGLRRADDGAQGGSALLSGPAAGGLPGRALLCLLQRSEGRRDLAGGDGRRERRAGHALKGAGAHQVAGRDLRPVSAGGERPGPQGDCRGQRPLGRSVHFRKCGEDAGHLPRGRRVDPSVSFADSFRLAAFSFCRQVLEPVRKSCGCGDFGPPSSAPGSGGPQSPCRGAITASKEAEV